MTDLKTDCATSAVMVKLPSTPAEVIDFIGSHFEALESGGLKEDRRYTLTVHDLLSAFSELGESAASPNAELVEALKRIGLNEAQVFDEDLGEMVLVSMEAELMVEIARAALAAAGVQP